MEPPDRETLKVPRAWRAGPPRVSHPATMESIQAVGSGNSCKSIRSRVPKFSVKAMDNSLVGAGGLQEIG